METRSILQHKLHKNESATNVKSTACITMAAMIVRMNMTLKHEKLDVILRFTLQFKLKLCKFRFYLFICMIYCGNNGYDSRILIPLLYKK